MEMRWCNLVALCVFFIIWPSAESVAVPPESFVSVNSFNENLFVGSVYQLNATTGRKHMIASGQITFFPYGLSYDPLEQRVYWTEAVARTVTSVRLDGAEKKVLHTFGACAHLTSCGPDGLAVDYLQKLVFFAGANQLAVVSTNGTGHRVVLDTEGSSPYGVTLDLVHEVIYYTIQSGTPRIGRVCYNGSVNTFLVKTFQAAPLGIILDTKRSRLYWCSSGAKRIESVLTDGSDRRVVLSEWSSSNDGFFFLSLLGEDTLLFSDFTSSRLRSVKTDGSNVSTFGEGIIQGARGVYVYDPGSIVTLEERDSAAGSCDNLPPPPTPRTTPVPMTTQNTAVDTTRASPVTPPSSDASTDVTTKPVATTNVISPQMTSDSVTRPNPEVSVTPTPDVTTGPSSPGDGSGQVNTWMVLVLVLGLGLVLAVTAVLVVLVRAGRLSSSCCPSPQPAVPTSSDLISLEGSGDSIYDRLGSVSTLPPPAPPPRALPPPAAERSSGLIPEYLSLSPSWPSASSGESTAYLSASRVAPLGNMPLSGGTPGQSAQQLSPTRRVPDESSGESTAYLSVSRVAPLGNIPTDGGVPSQSPQHLPMASRGPDNNSGESIGYLSVSRVAAPGNPPLDRESRAGGEVEVAAPRPHLFHLFHLPPHLSHLPPHLSHLDHSQDGSSAESSPYLAVSPVPEEQRDDVSEG